MFYSSAKPFSKHIRNDNVVYHGLAGQFLCKGIPGILKARILANTSDRIKEEMARENITEKQARFILKKDDEERRKWGMYLYGIDTKDSSLYDLVLHIDNLKVDDAVDLLSDAAGRPCFQTTAETLSFINDFYIAAKTQELLFDKFPDSANWLQKRGRHGIDRDVPWLLSKSYRRGSRLKSRRSMGSKRSR